MATQPGVAIVPDPIAPSNDAAFPSAWTAPDGFIFRPIAGNVYTMIAAKIGPV